MDDETRAVVADHDPREHRARLDDDETLCGLPVLMEIQHDRRLTQCPECRAAMTA